MKGPAPADLQRWSEEVARDATSLSFLPLAKAYRRQGKRDAALRLCLRGLEHHPDNVDGHSLLAMLYFESGQRVKAYDEWSMVLTLEPDNFDALRGMGFYYLEQEDHAAAKRHLERAHSQKPTDPAVEEGLRIVRERLGEVVAEEQPASWEPTDYTSSGPVPAPGPAPVPPASATVHAAAAGAVIPPVPVPTPEPEPRVPVPGPAPVTVPGSDDPSKIFEPLMRGGQVLGALVLDTQGLVMAGSLSGDVATQAETLGAILGGAIEEAVRTAAQLSLGPWSGVLMEADTAVLHIAPISEGMIVLLAAERNAPAGWVLRSAQQAAFLAKRFMEAYA